MNSLFQKEKIYRKGSFSLSFTVSSCTTKPLSSQFWLDNAEENVAYLVLVQWWGDDRQVSQSGKPLCTGASLWAVPKLARGLCPLEPRHVNGVSIPAKCPPDIPAEHLLIDQGITLHPPKGRCPLWNPVVNLSVRMICLLIKNKNQAKKGDECL